MPFYKWSTTGDAYSGLAQSVETSNTFFTGDAVMVTFSLTTSSTTASSWTAMGNASDGFFSAIDATQWQPVKTVTQQGYYSLDTLPRWLAFQRTASASSTTITLSLYVGP
jgi:hypothetical protein